MKQFVSNIKASFLLKIFQFLSNFFVVAFVIKNVGIEQWGILTLSLSLISALSFLQSGFSAGLSRDLSNHYYSKNMDKYSKLMNNAVMLTLGIVLSIVIINAIFYFLFKHSYILFNNENLLVYILIAISVLFQVLQIPFMAAFQSINKVSTIEYINIFSIALRVILVFSLFYFNNTIFIYASILFIENLVRLISMIVLLEKKEDLYLIKKQSFRIERKEIVDILKNNTYIIINGLNYLILIQLTVVSLNRFYSLELIGYFGIALQINSLIRSFAALLSKSMAPIFNILNAKKKISELQEVFKFSHEVFIFIGGSLLIFMLLIGNKLYLSLISVNNKELLSLLNYFNWFIFFGIISVPITNLLVTINKIKLPSLFGLFFTSIYLFIINFYNFGEKAYFFLPILLSITYLSSFIIKIYYGIRNLYNVNSFYKEILKQIVTFLAIVVLLFFFTSYLNNNFLINDTSNLISLLLPWLLTSLFMLFFFFRIKKIKGITKILRSF